MDLTKILDDLSQTAYGAIDATRNLVAPAAGPFGPMIDAVLPGRPSSGVDQESGQVEHDPWAQDVISGAAMAAPAMAKKAVSGIVDDILSNDIATQMGAVGRLPKGDKLKRAEKMLDNITKKYESNDDKYIPTWVADDLVDKKAPVSSYVVAREAHARAMAKRKGFDLDNMNLDDLNAYAKARMEEVWPGRGGHIKVLDKPAIEYTDLRQIAGRSDMGIDDLATLARRDPTDPAFQFLSEGVSPDTIDTIQRLGGENAGLTFYDQFPAPPALDTPSTVARIGPGITQTGMGGGFTPKQLKELRKLGIAPGDAVPRVVVGTGKHDLSRLGIDTDKMSNADILNTINHELAHVADYKKFGKRMATERSRVLGNEHIKGYGPAHDIARPKVPEGAKVPASVLYPDNYTQQRINEELAKSMDREARRNKRVSQIEDLINSLK